MSVLEIENQAEKYGNQFLGIISLQQLTETEWTRHVDWELKKSIDFVLTKSDVSWHELHQASPQCLHSRTHKAVQNQTSDVYHSPKV